MTICAVLGLTFSEIKVRILIHSPHSVGGIAEHTRYQFLALQKVAEEVTLFCPPDFLDGRRFDGCVFKVYYPLLRGAAKERLVARLIRLTRNGLRFLANQWRLAWEVFVRKPDAVLLDSYMEYLSPLWVWPHLLLAKSGVTKYAANLHDPVRDFVVGPRWWHQWSVFLAYAPLRIGVVHERLTGKSFAPAHVAIYEAPVGVYDLNESHMDCQKVRRSWGAPEDAVVFLAFGFIRDNKNLDLLVKALKQCAEAFLVVVGSAQSSKNKPLQFYRDLAEREGVADRILFRDEFVPDEALASYFQAADYLVMTYNSEFHSQSGVLNIAARARRRVLASSGESPLKSCVQRFALGEFVEPDNLASLVAGMGTLCRQHRGEQGAPEVDWKGYEGYASWDSNASIISNAIQESYRRGAQ